MKVIVAIKRVVDYNINVRLTDDRSDIERDGIKMSMNPFCEIAVEQAVRLKEQGLVDEVVVVSIGDAKTQEQLRHALAMGADRGILVETATSLEPISLAQGLAAIIQQEQPDVVLMGKQSVDGDNAQTAAMVSALMDAPIAHCISTMQLESQSVTVRYDRDQGECVARLTLPAVLTADLRLAEPRFVKLPNKMKAKKKPLQVIAFAELGISVTPHVRQVALDVPVAREGQTVMCDSLADFTDKLCSGMEG